VAAPEVSALEVIQAMRRETTEALLQLRLQRDRHHDKLEALLTKLFSMVQQNKENVDPK